MKTLTLLVSVILLSITSVYPSAELYLDYYKTLDSLTGTDKHRFLTSLRKGHNISKITILSSNSPEEIAEIIHNEGLADLVDSIIWYQPQSGDLPGGRKMLLFPYKLKSFESVAEKVEIKRAMTKLSKLAFIKEYRRSLEKKGSLDTQMALLIDDQENQFVADEAVKNIEGIHLEDDERERCSSPHCNHHIQSLDQIEIIGNIIEALRTKYYFSVLPAGAASME